MNPVMIKGKTARYASIPLIESQIDQFELECRQIFETRYAKGLGTGKYEKAKDQLAWELNNIRRNCLCSVFVIGKEISEIAGRDYWMNGHMASSLVAYLLGITHIDPLENELCKEAVWGLEGNRCPQLIFNEVKRDKIGEIVSSLQNRAGVGDVIKREKDDELILHIVPEGCDIKAYREMDEQELEIAIWCVIFRWKENTGEKNTSFEEEYFRLMEYGIEKAEAYVTALKIVKANGYGYKADSLEELHYVKGVGK